MGKHWARQQVRRNEVQDAVEKSVDWVQTNRQAAGGAALAVAAAVVIGGLAMFRTKSNREAAWEKLALAHALAYTGRTDQALTQVKEISESYGSTAAAGYALKFGGDVLFPRGQYKEAIEYYNKVLERGEPAALMPIALSDLASSQLAAGQPAEAAKTAERFLASHAEHFLAPQTHTLLARSLAAQGQAEAAKAAYQKIALQYPDTGYAAEAQQCAK